MMGIKIGLENWNLGHWEQTILLKLVIVFLNLNVFRKPRITVIDSSQWQVFAISIFSAIWGKAVQTPEAAELERRGRAVTVTHKKDCNVFIGKFS